MDQPADRRRHYAFTYQGINCRRGTTLYEYAAKTFTVVRQWQSGQTYQDLDIVRHTDSPSGHAFYKCVNPAGSGTNAPTPGGDNANWHMVGKGATFLIVASLTDTPPDLVVLQAIFLEGGQQPADVYFGRVAISLLQVFADATSNNLTGFRRQHTWQPPNGDALPFDYLGELEASRIVNGVVPAPGRTCSGLRSASLDGLLLNARPNLTNRFDPYFCALALLPATKWRPVFVKEALEALRRTTYSASTGTIASGGNPTQWAGFGQNAPADTDYASFPVRLEGTAAFGSTSNTISVAKADAHDAAAGLFAALAVNYCLAAPDVTWMTLNCDTVKQALLKNVARRRRRISQSVAFGTAMGSPWVTSGVGRNCGVVRAWLLGTAYSVNDLVWNPNLSLTTNHLYRCKSAHTSAAGDQPGVGGSWTAKWDVSTDTSSTPSPQFLTETFQAWREYTFLQFLDAVEAFVGYRSAFQLWTLREWIEDADYRRLEVVSYSSRFFECVKANDGNSKDTEPVVGDDWKLYWRELDPRHFPAPTLAAMGYSSGAITDFLSAANALYDVCPPHFFLEGIRTMWKWNEADENAAGEVNWNSVRYDSASGSFVGAEVNEGAMWYPDFLSYPFLVAFDVPLHDDPSVDAERKAAAFARTEDRIPLFWMGRNHDTFPAAVWAAAYAKLGLNLRRDQCVDFVQRHYGGTGREQLYNHERMWLFAAQRWNELPNGRLV